MKPEIQEIRDEIERLENKLRVLMHSCNHDNAKILPFTTAPSYYDKAEDCIYVDCADCGIQYTYDSEDKMYHILKARL